MKPLRVAVIGVGTAGAAAAVLLSRAGHDVTVYERVHEPGPVGAGIMMQPSGLMVLERLGCHARILERGARVERLRCETTTGRTVVDLAYEALAPGLYGVGLHRGVLFETLFEAVRASDAQLHCGVTVDRVAFDRGHLRALYNDHGERLGVFDLVILADGARSHLRDRLTDLPARAERYPWGALWFLGEAPDDRYAGVLAQRVRGTRTMIGVLPTGLGPGDDARQHASLYFSVAASEVESIRARGLAAWKAHVMDVAPMAAPLLDQIDSFEALTFANYHDVTMPRWHAPGIAVLGDAAHATSPQLGQGCNLALCDAATLADALADARSLAEGLALYSARRSRHLGYYQLATRWLTPFFQSDFEPLGALRDFAMPLAMRVPLARREMVRSMCGTKDELFSSSLPTRVPER